GLLDRAKAEDQGHAKDQQRHHGVDDGVAGGRVFPAKIVELSQGPAPPPKALRFNRYHIGMGLQLSVCRRRYSRMTIQATGAADAPTGRPSAAARRRRRRLGAATSSLLFHALVAVALLGSSGDELVGADGAGVDEGAMAVTLVSATALNAPPPS